MVLITLMIQSKAFREAIGLGGEDIRAWSRPATGGDPGAQGQAADTQVPCGPKGDAFQGEGDIGVANVIFQSEWSL